ncbi:MAG: VOC family protein [Acidovorax sp.]|uniref:VOC family protein n=1 Tax=Acidovorax sp. TaxID=1872122 RepID=UPI0025C3BA9A|nr:VOC family protein [Acidovorax sp.]MCE1192036.1 VOC family protein [Acidovorax sp.]
MTAPATGPCVDHLVVLAADLASGVAWCERTLGVTPAAGGEHPLMGTHNRILNISSPAHPRAYLEVIAINPGAGSTRPTGAKRWFDMDDATLQAQVAAHGPQCIHWVASVPDVAERCAALAALDIDRGPVLTASRPTPSGLLQWQITVRDDGLRLMDGCLPTLIQWGPVHPCDSLPASGVQLHSLALQHPQAATLQAACQAIGVANCVEVVASGAPRLTAQLSTPRGPLTLSSSCFTETRTAP